jgi:hypothetical protein
MNAANTLLRITSVIVFIYSSAPVVAMEGQLNGTEITDTIVGHKIHGVTAKGAKWNGIYQANGTMQYDKGKTGTWRLNGDMICDTPKGDKEYCRSVVKISDKKFQMMKEDGSKGGTITSE